MGMCGAKRGAGTLTRGRPPGRPAAGRTGASAADQGVRPGVRPTKRFNQIGWLRVKRIMIELEFQSR